MMENVLKTSIKEHNQWKLVAHYSKHYLNLAPDPLLKELLLIISDVEKSKSHDLSSNVVTNENTL